MSQAQKRVYQQKYQHLKNQLNQVQNERDDYQNKWDNSFEDLEQKEEIIRGYLQKIGELENEKGQLNTDLKNTRNQLTIANTLINNTQNLLGINGLNNLPLLPQGETLNTLLARPTPTDLQTEQNRARNVEQLLKQWADKFVDKNADQIDNLLKEKGWTIANLNGQIASLRSENSKLQEKSIDNYTIHRNIPYAIAVYTANARVDEYTKRYREIRIDKINPVNNVGVKIFNEGYMGYMKIGYNKIDMIVVNGDIHSVNPQYTIDNE